MSPKDWIKRWIKENQPMNQTQLAEKAGIMPAKVSDILRGKQSGTVHYMRPLSLAMNISLDSIYDPAAKWPGKSVNGESRLSAAEKEILKEAHYYSEGDETLAPAMRRLKGLATTQVVVEPGQVLKPDKSNAIKGKAKSG